MLHLHYHQFYYGFDTSVSEKKSVVEPVEKLQQLGIRCTELKIINFIGLESPLVPKEKSSGKKNFIQTLTFEVQRSPFMPSTGAADFFDPWDNLHFTPASIHFGEQVGTIVAGLGSSRRRTRWARWCNRCSMRAKRGQCRWR